MIGHDSPRAIRIFLAVILLIVLAMFIHHRAAHARDLDGQYAQSDNHDWVKSLHSPAGMWCCDISDGRTLLDADWRSSEGHYQVRYKDQWLDVKEDAVITQPNRLGRTMAWIGWHDGEAFVTCFLPGPMT